jgi:hypothetical protein
MEKIKATLLVINVFSHRHGRHKVLKKVISLNHGELMVTWNVCPSPGDMDRYPVVWSRRSFKKGKHKILAQKPISIGIDIIRKMNNDFISWVDQADEFVERYTQLNKFLDSCESRDE